MFARNSRYYGLEVSTTTVADADGVMSEARYVLRRFIGRERPVALASHRVVSGDRLDNIATSYFNDPTQFWRIADMNRARQAEDVCDQTGRSIEIPSATTT
jgi:hypothetical protein